MKPGEIVISTAGRDTGRYFIVISVVNNRYILVADGDIRRIDDPKLKNAKHVKSTGYIIEELSIWLAEGRRIRNEDLRGFILDYQKNEEAR